MENPLFASVVHDVYKKLGLPQDKYKKSGFDMSLRFARKPFVSLVPSRIRLILPEKIADPVQIVHQFHRKRMTMPAMAEQLKNIDIFEPIHRKVLKNDTLSDKFSKSASGTIKRSGSTFKINVANGKICINDVKNMSLTSKSRSLQRIKFKLN